MLKLGLDKPAGSAYNVLCLGAHSDDIEIGCGGTVLKLIQSHQNIAFYWVVFGASASRAEEARASAQGFLSQAAAKTVVIKDFKNSFFPYLGAEIKEWFEGLKQQFSPDLILTHYRGDLHQDHRVVSELTWNSFRDHLILEYEIPKYDGDLGVPNFFVDLDRPTADRKIGYILEYFKSQSGRHWFERETFLSLMRLRGVESCTRYAEAFYCRKALLA